MNRSALVLACVSLAVTPATADELLLFDNGFTVVVAAWSIDGGALHMVLPGGGEVVARGSLVVEARQAEGEPGVITWRRAPSGADGPLEAIARTGPASGPHAAPAADRARSGTRARPTTASTTLGSTDRRPTTAGTRARGAR